jgi:hypothetical protein
VVHAYPRFSGSVTTKRVEEVLDIAPGESAHSWTATESRYGDDWVEEPYPMDDLQPVTAEYLWDTRQYVISMLASRGLIVGKPMSVSERQEWDRVVGLALFERLDFDVYEAFDDDVWTYLTIFLFWDFPQWRFPGKKFKEIGTTPTDEEKKAQRPADRVLGGSRNVLFRTWLRVYVLGPDFAAEGKVDFAGEDILDNLFGRPTISQDHSFSRAILRTLYRNEPCEVPIRRPVFREFMKSIRRRTANVNFTATGDLLDRELDKLWSDARVSIDDSDSTD